MKLEFHCWKCPKDAPGRRITAAFSEQGYYSFRCAHGHVHDIVTGTMLFELLAETGMQAIVDGYFRDAIASFMASYERTLQFYIDVVSRAKDIDPATADATWKHVSSQSERQLGMYIGLYQLENNAVPPLLAQKHVNLRNRVVHQGYLPSEEDAVLFAQAVVDLLQPLLNGLMQRYTAQIESFIAAQTAKGATAASAAQRTHNVFFEFLLRFDTEADDWNRPPADIRAELKARRDLPSKG
ncbi:hypothetical protein [Sphingobium sp. TCM1]|jgi:hypothetical protein|uniref:hypothetical protein n=1 Tax=Sphingobium sp. TCM1 TaxID=453246 RepID=UPI00082E78BF|nr:hypothetical protein [Sphingobium sp. TCM1]